MESIIDHSTSDSSTPRGKCWEPMKPAVAKLKNIPTSFWCFLTMLIPHASMMDWTDICALAVNSNKFYHKVSAIYEVKSKENVLKQINIKKPVTRLKQAVTTVAMSTALTAISSNPATTTSPSKKVIPAYCRLAKQLVLPVFF